MAGPDYDAVVIGSGAGGGAVAWALCRQQLRVLVLEAGPVYDPATDYRLAEHTWEQDGFPYWSHLRHALSFWEYRHLPNIHFFHYDDLQRDLDQQMRRVARILGVEIDEAIWPELVEAATFESMKARADELAPDASEGAWKSNASFFNRGSNGQWRGRLSAENLKRYDEVIAERLPPDLAEFLEAGTSARDPKAG
jgi:aryl sulfotransferase